MNRLHALVPLKTLSAAKSRLASVLTPSERSLLVEAMARDVLGILVGHEEIASVTLLSNDPAARSLAAESGAGFVDEDTLEGHGLNAVVAESVALLAAEGAQSILVVHGDVPALQAADVSAALQAHRASAGLVVGTDFGNSGSNLLLFAAATPPEFHYGENSCDLHSQWARDRGIEVCVLQQPGLAMDVDEPGDLQELIGSAILGAHTGAYLALSGLASRLQPPSGDQWRQLRAALAEGRLPDASQALSLAAVADTPALIALAGKCRDRGHGNVITYSRKVFIPLTQLCRDVCHYCTFAQTPKKIEQPFMTVEQVLELCRQGAAMGCQEALFTLGEKPELRYSAARKALAETGLRQHPGLCAACCRARACRKPACCRTSMRAA